MAHDPVALRARYVFPVTSPPIRDGCVLIWDGAVIEVGPSLPDHVQANVVDLGNVALLPGLCNAHTHLEFSKLGAPVGSQGMPFPDWIRQVIVLRREHPELFADAVEAGISESLSLGITRVADIAQAPWPEELDDADLEVLTLRELIAPTIARLEAARSIAKGHFVESGKSLNIQAGLSPHAPYTVHPELLSGALEISRVTNCTVAMHLAETREELEFMRTGGGPLRLLLDELGAWDGGLGPFPQRPMDYLRRLAGASRVLVIHGNYLDDEEIAFLAANAHKMRVVYCPRTHAYFGHDRYPLAKMLAAGVHVAFGTDSRASNPDLSILEEMRWAAREHPDVAPEKILWCGTVGDRTWLPDWPLLGRVGMIAVELPDRDAEDPHELLLGGNGRVIGTWFRGRRVFG